MTVTISNHALIRYTQRVAPVSLREARKRIMACERAILAAASIGCTRVVMACRSTLILDGARVVTVYPVEQKRSARTGSGARSKCQRIRRNDKGRQGWRASMEDMEHE